MPDYSPPFPDDKATRTMSATVIGGRMVDVTGAPAAAGATNFDGIASRDAVAGQAITVHYGPLCTGVAASTINQGDPIKCAAGGTFATWVSGTDPANALVGTAEQAAVAGASFQFYRR